MYKKKSKGLLKHWDFMLLDMLCLQVAFVWAYFMRMGLSNPYEASLYRNVAIYIELIDIAVLLLFGTLSGVLKRGYAKELVKTIQHCVLVGLIAVFCLFVTKTGGNFSRITLMLTTLVYFVLTFIVRILWKDHLRRVHREAGTRSLLIVTTEDRAAEVIDNIRQKDFSMLMISGLAVIDKSMVGSEINGVRVVADKDSVLNYVCREWVDEVFTVSPTNPAMPEDLLRKLSETGVVIHINIPYLEGTYGKEQTVEEIGGYTVVTSTMSFITQRQLVAKRLMDIIGGFFGSLIACIIFIFVAPAIYIKSPGPIFFRQQRVGQNGKLFTMYKFRSMHLDAEERKAEFMEQNRVKDGMMFKLEFDPRVIGNKVLPDGTKKTGIGEFIRKTSLDEFPQFFNVLKGDMSLVGTRPPTIDEWNKYELRHRARLAIKPGITGMWQVSGRSDIDDFEEVVRLDTKYIREWSLALDIKILLKTVKNVLTHKGAM